MKQLLLVSLLWLATLPAMAQGTLNFVTKITGSLDAPVFDTDGVTRLSGSGFRAQLYAGSSEATLAPVGAAVSFRTGAGAGYVDTSAGSTREVSGVASGTSAYAQVRAWDASKGSSYDQAAAAGGKTGRSLVIRVTAGGGLLPPANLIGLAAFKLEQNSPPGILTQPNPVTVGVGATARFTVVASGPTPYSYQWRKGSSDISGATLASYEIRSVTAGDAGTYSVRVTNPFGSTESRGALLTIAPIPNISRISVSPSPAQLGKPLRLEATAEGSGPFTYQWTLNGANLPGATSAAYETPSAAAGTYAVKVTGPGGTATKDATTVSANFLLELVVELGGRIEATPTRDSYTSGSVVSLHATAEDGFEFIGWSGDASGTANPVNVTMTAHRRVEALFRTVGGTVYFANRSLAVGIDAPVFESDGKTKLAGAAYRAQLYAGPDDASLAPVGSPSDFREDEGAGYFFSEVRAIPTVSPGRTARVQIRAWKVSDGATYEAAKAAKGHTGRSAILSVVTGNAGSPPTLPAFLVGLVSFSLDEQIAPSSFRLTLTQAEGGTATATPVQETYAPGTSVTLNATASDGYAFTGWSGTLSGTANPATVIMNSDQSISPIFSALGGTVYFANRVLASGIEAPIFDTDGRTPLAGDAFLAQLYAGPSEDALAPIGAPSPFRSGEGAGYFLPENRAIRSVPAGQTAFIQVRAWEAADGATYEIAKAAKGATGRSPVLSVVTGNAGNPPTLPAFLVGLSSFSLDEQVVPTAFTLTILPTEGGHATATPAQASYAPGTKVSVQATAHDGYIFSGWSGALSGTENPATVVLDANKSVSPVFTALGGTVYFANRVLASGINAPIFDTDGKTPLAGDAFFAQLFGGPSEDVLAPIGPTSVFRTGDGAGYFLPGNRALRSVPAGQTAYVQIRAWAASAGATFDSATAANGKSGASAILKVTTGNAGTPPTLPANLTGLASFSLQQSSAPRITVQPKPIAIALGGTATFEVTATGTAPLAYAWTRNGNPLPSATSRVLTLARVSAEDVGSYAVRVSNAKGFIDSTPAALSLLKAPEITRVNVVPTPPVPGRPLRIEVTATGSEPLRYSWTRNDNPIAGATAAILERAAAELGTYAVHITGPGGSTSREVTTVSSRFVLTLLVDQGGRIKANPEASPYAAGSKVELTAIPEEGYVFTGWSGDVSGDLNPVSLVMDAHKSVTATFRPTGGTLFFANRSLAFGIDAPIFDEDGTTRLSGDGYLAQLFAGPSAEALLPVGQPSPFRTGDGAGYFLSGVRSIPTVSPGATAFVQVRAWKVRDGDLAKAGEDDDEDDDDDSSPGVGRKTGASEILQIKTGNQGNPPTLPAYLVGLSSFKISEATLPTVSILAPPGSITVGEKAQLLAIATGSRPITFRWYQGESGNTSTPVGEGTPAFTSNPLFEATSFWVQASNAVGTANSATLTVTVVKKSQSIVFAPLPPVVLGGSPLTLAARASSGLPVTFSLVSGPATLDGSILTPTGTGTARVRASQDGDATYQAASPVEADVQILRGRAIVLLENLQQIADGSPKQPSVITTPPGLPFTLTYEGRLSPPSEPGTYPVTAVVDSAEYSGRAHARFQLTPGVNLVGVVFKDLNSDGRRQGDEPGLEGATVEVLDLESGAALKSVITTGDGTFAFPGLPPAGYRLRETNPAGYVSTTPDVRLVNVQLDTVTEILFGDQPAGTVSGLVYEDLDGDGTRSDGESGLAGVTITLHGSAGSRTTVTDAAGSYEFPNVQAGSYRVEETDPAGFSSTTPNTRTVSVSAGGAATASFGDQSVGTVSGTVFSDLNANGEREDSEPGLGGVTILLTGREGTLTRTSSDAGTYQFEDLTPGPYTVEEIDPAGYTSTTPNRRTVHVGSRGAASASFGDQELGTVSGLVFDDFNGNGLHEDGEPGLSGVALRLTGAGNRRTTTTSSEGRFQFSGIEPGNYHLEELDPVGFTSTTPNVRILTVISGGAASAAFGDQAAGNIAGIVFADQNANGLRDDAESGIGGVSIRLSGADGSRSAMTSSDGTYLFTGLTPGTYTVEETDPVGFVSTTPNSRTVSLASGGAASASFGDQAVKTISGVVFEDQNGNGALDSGEPGIGGVALSLLRASDESEVRETTTASSGIFVFADVPAGDYIVRQTVPESYTVLTTPGAKASLHALPGGSEFQNKPVTLAEGGAASVSFGNNVTGQITGLVFDDLDGDGEADSSEPGLAGVTLTVREAQSGNTVATTTTSGSGLFVAGNLPAGSYQIVPSAVAGYASRRTTITVSLAANGAAVANFAHQAIGTISGRVFNDEDGDGSVATSEPGLGGIVVSLTLPDGSQRDTSTSGDGAFLFTGLTAGAYTVAFTAPDGFTATTPISTSVTLSAGGAGAAIFGAQARSTVTEDAYTSWAATQNLPSQLRRASDDADGDGLANLFEFFTGSNPISAASGDDAEPVLVSKSSQSHLGFRVTRTAAARSVRPVLQASDDLIHWSVTASVIEESAAPDGAQVLVVHDAAPTSSHGHRFLRFGLELANPTVTPATVTVVSGPPLSSTFQISVAGDVGATYRLEWSTDLVTWTLLRNITTGSSPTVVSDQLQPGERFRFYRTVVP